MAEVTLTELRKDLFRLADSVLDSGQPVRIRRNGRTLILKEETAAPEQSDYAKRFEAFFASPPPLPAQGLGFEDIEANGEAVWTWSPDEALDPSG